MTRPPKIFGLDSEGSNRTPGYPTRTIQIYSPTRQKTMLLHKPPGWTVWKIIWVDVIKALELPVERGEEAIHRTTTTQTDDQVRSFLTNPEHGFITQNGYYDFYKISDDLGVEPNVVGDSFIYGLMMPTGPQVSKSLGNLMSRYVVNKADSGDLVVNYDKNRYGGWEDHEWDVEDLSPEAILYASFDPYACYVIETTLIAEYPQYNNHVYKLELDLLRALCRMQKRGVKVLEDGFAKSLFEYRQKVAHLQEQLNEKAGWVVRVGSEARS